MASESFLSKHDPDINFFNSIDNTCRMVLPNELHFLNETNNNFSILHLNCRSIFNKLGELNAFLSSCSSNQPFSTIGLTETWLNDISAPLVSIPDYNFLYKNRPNRSGGGVGLLIHKNLDYVEINLLANNNTCEVQSIEIINSKSKNLIIIVIYRPPDTDPLLFLDFMNSLCSEIPPNKSAYIMGDFNIDLLKPDCHDISTNFTNTLNIHNFFPLIHLPTRVTDSSSTLIDNIFCNQLISHNSGVIYNDISDHFPIFSAFNNINSPIPISSDHAPHNFSSDNLINLVSHFESYNWDAILSIDNVDIGFDSFNYVIQNALTQFCPLIYKSKRKRKKNPWMTSGLIISSLNKNNLYKKYLNNPNIFNKTTYLKYKNIFTSIIRAAQKKFYLDQFSINKSNIKKHGTL